MAMQQSQSGTCIKFLAEDFSFLDKEDEKFVLMDRSEIVGKSSYGSFQMLVDSLMFSGLISKFKDCTFRSKCEGKIGLGIKLSLGETVMCKAVGDTVKSAKEEAAKALLQALRMKFYTIKMLKENERSVFLITYESLMEPYGEQHPQFSAKEFSEDDDRLHCISDKENQNTPQMQLRDRLLNNKVFEFSVMEVFSYQVMHAFDDYTKSDITSDLVFSSEFTKEEQQIIRSIGTKTYKKKLELREERYEDGRNRMYFSKCFTSTNLFDALIKAGGRTNKYLLYPPACTVQGW